MPSLRRDSSGAAQVLALLTAGLLFIGIISVLLFQAAQPGKDSSLGAANDAAGRDRDADTLAQLLAGSAGAGWAGGADSAQRLGLLAANGSALDPARIAALQGASNTASLANGKLDYPDARTGLGLAPGQDFHLRITQTATSGSSGVILNGVRTAYIGDWTSLASVTVPLGTSQQIQDAAQTKLNLTMFATTATERDMLKGLGLTFNNRVYLGPLAPTVLVDLPTPIPDAPILTYLNLPLIQGDVYPDIKSYIDANLPGRLANYDLLVIGSGIDQSTLTASAVKNGIGNWVLAGGRLMVLGSDSSNYQWLQPIFQSSVASVSGAVTAASPIPAALTTPFNLAWATYNTHNLAWDIKKTGGGAHYNDFDHLVTQGGYDVLAISHKGGFGNGYVVLSSFRPRELSSTEASHLMTNLIQYKGAPQNYTVDYGPAIPTDLPVSGAQRTAIVWDPIAGRTTLRLDLFVWDAT